MTVVKFVIYSQSKGLGIIGGWAGAAPPGEWDILFLVIGRLILYENFWQITRLVE